MLKPRIQIVEDDPSYALELEMILSEMGYEVLPVIDSAKKAKYRSDSNVDLLIADIFYDGRPIGLEIVEEWQGNGVPVILMTSSKNEAVYKASKISFPSGYLIKPIEKLSLQSTIERVLVQSDQIGAVNKVLAEWTKEQMLRQFLFVRHKKSLVKLTVEDISYVEADGNYCYIHEKGRRYAVKNSLRNFKDQLSPMGFLQINRGNLINFRMIDTVSFSKSEIIMGGIVLPIGDAYRNEVNEWLNRL